MKEEKKKKLIINVEYQMIREVVIDLLNMVKSSQISIEFINAQENLK